MNWIQIEFILKTLIDMGFCQIVDYFNIEMFANNWYIILV